MLDLDRHVITGVRELPGKAAHDSLGVPNAVKEVGIPERDVAGAGGDLGTDVSEHDVVRDDAEASVVHAHDRAVAASMLAAARGFGVSDGPAFGVQLKGGVPRERRQSFTCWDTELEAGDTRCDTRRAGLQPAVRAAHPINQILLELAAENVHHSAFAQ